MLSARGVDVLSGEYVGRSLELCEYSKLVWARAYRTDTVVGRLPSVVGRLSSAVGRLSYDGRRL